MGYSPRGRKELDMTERLHFTSGGAVEQNLPPNVEETRDRGSIPGLGRSPEVGNGNPLEYFYLKIPWSGEPGGLQSMGLRRIRHE